MFSTLVFCILVQQLLVAKTMLQRELVSATVWYLFIKYCRKKDILIDDSLWALPVAECKCWFQYWRSSLSSGPQRAAPVLRLPDAHKLPAHADHPDPDASLDLGLSSSPDTDPCRRPATQPRSLPPSSVRTTLTVLNLRCIAGSVSRFLCTVEG